jgi:hypothetical protein
MASRQYGEGARTKRLCLAGALVATLVVPTTAVAGGSPSDLVGVGRTGSVVDVQFPPAPAGDRTLRLARPVRPVGYPVGYVRLFWRFDGNVGLTGEWFPGRGVLCGDGNAARTTRTCGVLGQVGREFMARMGHLPLWRVAPSVAVRIRADGHVVPQEAAVELAAIRRGEPSSGPASYIRASVVWSGPMALQRPQVIHITPGSIYFAGTVHPSSRLIWSFAKGS